MQQFFVQIRKSWFQIRIFISLSIVLIISLLSFLVFKSQPTSIEIAGSWFGLSGALSIRYGYYIVIFLVLLASLIRMWAGSILTSRTVMSFKIQNSKFQISGPYQLIRNPIYFADLIAFTALSFCLRPVGLLIPLLICLHYFQLIRYEEEKLKAEFGDSYEEYIRSTRSLFPRIRGMRKILKAPLNFHINSDGFRHNAQYILFIPGLMIAASTGKFIHAILIGLPAVIDWAVIHTIIGLSKRPVSEKSTSRKKALPNSKIFRDILYAQCWEDPELDRIAFRIKPGDTVFSITSGGCNALSFLVDDPAKVVCLDMSKYQNYLLSLKLNAFKVLDYNELLEFLGIHPSQRRSMLYQKVKPALSNEEQTYWNSKLRDINRGIIHCGSYERYMHLLKRVFRILIGGAVINKLFNADSTEERLRLFNKKWENFRWKLFCRIFLSRTFASLLFDKGFYRYLDNDFSFDKYYRSVVKRAVTELPLKENYFLAYILLGNYFGNNLPPYLKKENYELIRSRVNRIESITSGCLEYFRSLPSGSISKFNFTNIFEWMSPDEYSNLLRESVRVAKPGAILTYRNHLVTRHRPDSIAENLIPDEKLSAELHGRDLSFIYKAYVVERVEKN